jgi:hypothetical protein
MDCVGGCIQIVLVSYLRETPNVVVELERKDAPCSAIGGGTLADAVLQISRPHCQKTFNFTLTH